MGRMTSNMALTIFDLTLLLGLTLRLTRLVTRDNLGRWFIWDPALRWAFKNESEDSKAADYRPITVLRWRLISGLDCPFCIGFWLGALALTSLVVIGGPGQEDNVYASAWRVFAGVFALNYLAGQIGSRLDADPEE